MSFDTDEYPRGALALAAAAVSVLYSHITWPDHYLKAERSLKLWADGTITVATVRKAQYDKTLKIKFEPLLNSKGVETAGHASFSSTMWGKPTRGYLASIKSIPEDEMDEIIDAATQYIKGRNGTGDQSADEGDPRSQIANGSTSESEVEDNVAIAGWGRVIDLRSSSPLPEPQLPPKSKPLKVIATFTSKNVKLSNPTMKPAKSTK